MTNLSAIHDALLDWAGTVDPDARCLLSMTTPEVITLHYMLALVQSIIEKQQSPVGDMANLGALRKNTEHILVQAGYGGDPRP